MVRMLLRFTKLVKCVCVCVCVCVCWGEGVHAMSRALGFTAGAKNATSVD